MSTWTTPATWVNGAVSAATMNTEVRDHLNWLKGAIDLITNSTASDVGTATLLRVTRAAAGDNAIETRVSGDTQNRVTVNADGSIDWGSGTAASDVRLRRSVGGGGVLVDNNAGGAAAIQSVGDVVSSLGSSTDELALRNGFIAFLKRSAPSAPSAGALLWIQDNGAGKAQLAIRANTGAPTILWTQP